MPNNLQAWLTLAAAIVGELLGTTFLKLASGSSRPWAWLGVIGGYGAALWLLEKVIQQLDVGVVYALWSGIGIALASALGVIAFGESMSWSKALGLFAIAVGVVLLQLQTPE
ncbi:MAG: multidrug efflux SMR transporter [Myxococcales bacterium]